MKIGFVSDTHLGKNLKTNTTPSSRKRLQDKLYQTGLKARQEAYEICDVVIDCGDLFDKPHNTEEVIMQGINLQKYTEILLSGNHDVKNLRDDVTSFSLMGDFYKLNPVWESAGYNTLPVSLDDNDKGICTYAVPHCSSQEVFEQCLAKACTQANLGAVKILLLHCNYDNPFAEEKDQDLNLSKELAKNLLSHFDYIFMGHEHQHATHFDGRLVIVGNQHPTSFSDVSDRYWLEFDTETKELTKHQTYDANRYVALTLKSEKGLTEMVEELSDPDISTYQEVDFITLSGRLPQSCAAKVNDLISLCWKTCEPIAVRNKVEFEVEYQESDEEISSLDDLPSVIAEELDGGELAGWYNDLLKEVKAGE